MINSSKFLRVSVSKQETGMRLDAFLKEHLDSVISGKKIKFIIDGYGCKINGKVELFSSRKVRAGDKVEFDLSKLEIAVKSPIKIIYQDDDFWIIDKPSFVLTDDKKIQEALKKTPFYVHRLDKQTSGLLIIAKNSKTQMVFEDLFKGREIVKTYLALVDGDFPKKHRLKNYLGKVTSYDGQAIWGEASEKKGFLAITQFECLETKRHISLVKCLPETGRTHQIRVHLASLGFPILGDSHYAREHTFSLSVPRILLHAYHLAFKHPKTGELLEINAPLPKDFQQVMEKIGIKNSHENF